MAKKAWLAALVLISYQWVSAQQAAVPPAPSPMAPSAQAQLPVPPQPDAPYMKSPTVPSFHLLRADSATYLTNDDLKKHRPILIMYFNPDCEHCKHQTEFILADFAKFKDIEIVMATFEPMGEMKDFIAHYKLDEYPNIKVGRDEKYSLAPFYKIRNLPYLALYDKKGALISTYEGTHTADVLLNAFEQKK